MNECCKDENLAIAEERESVVVRVCQVCGAKHYELEVDAGVICGS